MASYTFDQRCRPRGEFRIPELLEFLDLVQEAFRCSSLYDSRSKPVNLTEPGLQRILEQNVSKPFPSIGANVHLFTIPPLKRDNNTVAIEIHTGTRPDEPFIDAYNISMGNKRIVPDFDYFEKSIEIFKPFEAFLAEGENEYTLNSYNREQDIPGFSKPAIIRGFHYLDKEMADSIGGIKYCLKAPAWHIEKFCEGVLIELAPGPFDSSNPEHLQIQKEVMAYFDMLWVTRNDS